MKLEHANPFSMGELSKLKVICGECQTEMVRAGSIKSRSATDVTFRCPNEDCPHHLTGVRLRVEETEDK